MEIVRFNKIEEEYGAFSNLAPYKIFLDGTTWLTCEHYYQGQKTLDGEKRFDILITESVAEVIRKGRDKNLPLRPGWDLIRDEVMTKAVQAKVEQYHEIKKLLLSTTDKLIVFDNKEDSYWGIGFDASGKNMLGNIYVQIRDNLLKDGPYDELKIILDPPWVQCPEIPKGSIGWRMGYGEDYMCKFGTWYQGLSPEGKLRYQKLFPPPKKWKRFYS